MSHPTIRELQKICGEAAGAKGFHDDRPRPSRIGASIADQKERQAALSNWQGNKLLLIVSEVVEAQDEIRNGYAADETYYPFRAHGEALAKPEGVPSEIADVVIRCLDFAYTEGFDLAEIITEKLAYNATRDRLHGKKF